MYPCQKKMIADMFIDENINTPTVQYKIYCQLTNMAYTFETQKYDNLPSYAITMSINNMIEAMCSQCPYNKK